MSSLLRLSHLLKSQIELHRKFIGLLILLYALLSFTQLWYFYEALVLGLILTSQIFPEIQNLQRTARTPLFPASSKELFLIYWLLTGPLYCLLMVCLYILLILIHLPLLNASYIQQSTFSDFWPGISILSHIALVYLSLNALFLWIAVFFKCYFSLKSILRLLFVTFLVLSHLYIKSNDHFSLISFFNDPIVLICAVMFGIVFWCLGYCQVKESNPTMITDREWL